jgi:hypothetical protein
MGVNIGFITGVMLGMELHEDEMFNYLMFDLLILRLTFFMEKSS